ncbi:hypothetical protein [Roseiconus lacunae]|uniref:hypothetical protein n=1 Tax=Roseiconus lacunae TaxID=2605694 RepID=UPI0013574652|nr:hypothetical protein [Roseiconus lacunae]
MVNLSKRFRLVLAASLFVLWVAWAYWANIPHYYDAQAMEQETAELFPAGPMPKIGPVVGGFPVNHMRYDFSRDEKLTFHDYSKDKLGLNVLLCALATIAVTSLALWTANVSRSNLVISAFLLMPACLAYALFRLHPLVIAYVYFLPLIILIVWSFGGLFRNEERQTHTRIRSRGDTVLDN